ncbi:hypothetical protein V0288_11335 [Pannus brasiliensis CCIBt3594]|uniref:Uncharacterized protein n=1 Tax=Pannus brasiliensis CCIBt3594 TaxID=1427578 RepID=A0AAW9QTU8_9CHRO
MTTVNVKLVKTLAEIIRSLSEEERNLLDSELAHQTGWDKIKDRVFARGKAIKQRRLEDLSIPSIEDIIYQMREDSDRELLQACGFDWID